LPKILEIKKDPFCFNFEWYNSYHAYLEEIDYEIETANNTDTSIFNKISF